METMYKVIDMLTGMIGDKATVDELMRKCKPEARKVSQSPNEDFPQNKSATPEKTAATAADKKAKTETEERPMYNYVHYDPEMHWCKVCNIFPKIAKEYLTHLHSAEHKDVCNVRTNEMHKFSLLSLQSLILFHSFNFKLEIFKFHILVSNF